MSRVGCSGPPPNGWIIAISAGRPSIRPVTSISARWRLISICPVMSERTRPSNGSATAASRTSSTTFQSGCGAPSLGLITKRIVTRASTSPERSSAS
jgi:hypothetical protein